MINIKHTLLLFKKDELLVLWMFSLFLVSCNKYSTYQEAARAYDFEAAHQILDKMTNETPPLNDYDKKRWEARNDEAFDYVFNAEAMYLCAKGDKESLDRLVFLLSSIPVKGVSLPEGTEYTSPFSLDDDVFDMHQVYIAYAIKFNQKCDVLVDLAIAHRCYYLIECIIPLYKPITEPLKESEEIGMVEQYGIVSTKYKTHRLHYNYKMREEAVEKVNKAIKGGAFPNVTKEIE